MRSNLCNRRTPLPKLVKLRFFAGLTRPEAAAALGISDATADRYWAYPRDWLHSEWLPTLTRTEKAAIFSFNIVRQTGSLSRTVLHRGTGSHATTKRAIGSLKCSDEIAMQPRPKNRSFRPQCKNARGGSFSDTGLREAMRPCPGQVDSAARGLRTAGQFSGWHPPGDRLPPSTSPGTRGRPGTHDRPLQAPASKSAKAAWASSMWPSRSSRSAAGGAEDHQAGHGHQARSSPASRPSGRPWR